MRQVVWCVAFALISSAAQAASDSDPLLDSATSTSSEIRGVLRARSQAVLASELSGRVTELPYAEGQSFSKGDVLVRFDCSAYQAQANAAAAAVRADTKSCATSSNWRRSIRLAVSR